MKIAVTSSGGFAGTTQVASLDTDNLNEATGRNIADLVRKANFFALPRKVPSQSVGADFQQYEISVTDGARQHSVTFIDDESPATRNLKDLVQQIAQTHS